MKSRVWNVLGLALLVASAIGCVGSEPPSNELRSSLLECPADVEPGLRCPEGVDPDLACQAGDLICSCAYDDEAGTDSVVVCREYDPDPGPEPVCPPDVETGATCDPDAADECLHDCSPSVHCRCTPTTNEPGCRHVWICDGTPPPPGPGECTDEDLQACLRGEADADVSCRIGDLICYCDPSSSEGYHCEPIDDPPPPHECTEEDLAACLAGGVDESMSCRLGDLTCYCDPDSPEGYRCEPFEPGPTDPPECDDIDIADALARCAAGEELECMMNDGRRCWCDPSVPGGYSCDDTLPPDPDPDYPPCEADGVSRCEAGVDYECALSDGTICRCEPGSAEGFSCG